MSAGIIMGRFPSEMDGVPPEDVFSVLASKKLDAETMNRG